MYVLDFVTKICSDVNMHHITNLNAKRLHKRKGMIILSVAQEPTLH